MRQALFLVGILGPFFTWWLLIPRPKPRKGIVTHNENGRPQHGKAKEGK